jgi:putative transposase
MTHRRDIRASHARLTPDAVSELLTMLTSAENPLSGIITEVLNAAMLLERQQHPRADRHERTDERNGYANGDKDRTIKTRLGTIELSVPQVRGSDETFRPAALDAAMASETALHIALGKMYIQGVATRRVKNVLESLCGFQISAMEVSLAARDLDTVLDAWRERPLGVTPFVQLDALWCKVRHGGLVQDAAVLVGAGIQEDGKRTILGVSVALGEHEIHWRTFMERLLQRGLTGVRMITRDDHAGLRAARKAVFGGVPWQRCQFHIQQNAPAYVPRDAMKADVTRDTKAILNAPDLHYALEALMQNVTKHKLSSDTKFDPFATLKTDPLVA